MLRMITTVAYSKHAGYCVLSVSGRKWARATTRIVFQKLFSSTYENKQSPRDTVHIFTENICTYIYIRIQEKTEDLLRTCYVCVCV